MDYYSVENYHARTSVGYLVRRAANVLIPRVEAAFADHEVSFVQWQILMQLRDGLARTSADLCRHMAYDSGALTRIIDQLDQRGLILRRRSTRDRRIVELELTQAGMGAVESLIPIIVRCLNQAVAGFTRDEADTLIRLLGKLIDGVSSLQPLASTPLMAEVEPLL